MTADISKLLAVRDAVATTVVGKSEALDQMLVALLCQGHVLLEDVPGVGKTLLARSLAAVIGCSFGRVQFTPDVLPSDVTGSSIFNQESTHFEFRPGPVFTEVLLADEINRATPRTQAALLEAMEERQVTVDGATRPLPRPFFVVATQNPIDLEGTFPLPEAQLDRFLVRVDLGYPTLEEEHEILRRFEDKNPLANLTPVMQASELIELQDLRGQVEVGAAVRDYLLGVTRATRVNASVMLGASPRAGLALHRAVQARTLLEGREFALPDDVKALAVPVLAHRIVLSATARMRGLTQADVVREALVSVETPVEDETAKELTG